MDGLIHWEPTLKCEQNEQNMLDYNTEKRLIQSVLHSKNCDVNYTLNSADGTQATSCVPVIDTCNTTGRWTLFDPFLLSACYFYEIIYTLSPSLGNIPDSGSTKYRYVTFAFGVYNSFYPVYSGPHQVKKCLRTSAKCTHHENIPI